jgi:alpha-D-ribose 1-methylphosphonate 5-triphosphate synthase subunit PhnG
MAPRSAKCHWTGATLKAKTAAMPAAKLATAIQGHAAIQGRARRAAQFQGQGHARLALEQGPRTTANVRTKAQFPVELEQKQEQEQAQCQHGS